MTLLPRLPRTAANRLLTDFLHQDGSSLRHLAQTPGAVQFAPTGGTRVTTIELLRLRRDIEKLADLSEAASRRSHADFDSRAAAYFGPMPILSSGEGLRDDVWSFIAIVVAPHIVKWRFGVKNRDRYLGGIRNTFQRLWVRGQILDRGEASQNRWGLLEALSEDAFVQIFERPRVGGNPPVARAIAEAWVRAANKFGRSGMELRMRQTCREVRAMSRSRSLSFLAKKDLADLLDAMFCNAAATGPKDSKSQRR